MSWVTLVLALLRAFPEVIALLKSIDERARSSANQKIGYDNAVRETLKIASDATASDAASDAEAESDHRTKPGDEAFDNEFRRK